MSFDIDWKAEPRFPATIRDAHVLVTDVEGLSDVDLLAVTAKRRSKATPLIVVSPGLHASGLALAGLGDVVSVHAVPLPGQSLRGLLEDLAVFAGARILTKDLGFAASLSAPHSATGVTAASWPGLVLPDAPWSEVSESDLGNVAVLQISAGRCSFSCTPAPYLSHRIEYLLRHEAGSDPDGLRSRLQRLGRPDVETARARSPQPPPDPSAIRIPAGFASPFFVTDPTSYDAVLEQPRVLLSAVPIERLECLMPFLQHAARESSSLIAVAPAFGPRALAAMVVNKLRGIVSCAAIELGSSSGAVESTLADLAAATGAEILVTADATVPSERITAVLGTAAKAAAGRSSSLLWAGTGR